MDICIATGNRHKKEELQAILTAHRLIIPSDLGIDFSCKETGHTFLDNALLKAKTLYPRVKQPVLSDDSGLCVEALQGAPGVYSARYGNDSAGKELTAEEQYLLLLKNMEGINNRRAFFVCTLVLMLDPYRVYTIQETLEGRIALSPTGQGGFGYDPVFFLEEFGCTLAEISPKEKNRISHRGKAAVTLSRLLKSQNRNSL